MFDFVDETFDEMALLIKVLVVRGRIFAKGPRWDHRLGAESEVCSEPFDVVCLVGDDVLGREAVDQRLGLRAVMCLAGRKDEPQRIAEGVDRDVDFGGRAAA